MPVTRSGRGTLPATSVPRRSASVSDGVHATDAISALTTELKHAFEGMAPASQSATIDKFYGTGDTSFELFLKRCNRYCQFMQFLDEKKVTFLPTCLAGLAEQVYDSIISQSNRDWSFTELTTALKQKLKPRNAEQLAFMKLRQRSQEPDEGVMQYALSVQKLVSMAHPNVGAEERLKIALQYFMSGLRESILKVLFGRNPTTLDEAIELAQLAEANESVFSPKRVVAAVDNNSVGLAEVKSLLENMIEVCQVNRNVNRTENQVQQKVAYPNPQRARWTPTDNRQRCYYCNRPGHHEVSCFKKQRDLSQKNCYYCQRPGHRANECYKKKREETGNRNVGVYAGRGPQINRGYHNNRPAQQQSRQGAVGPSGYSSSRRDNHIISEVTASTEDRDRQSPQSTILELQEQVRQLQESQYSSPVETFQMNSKVMSVSSKPKSVKKVRKRSRKLKTKSQKSVEDVSSYKPPTASLHHALYVLTVFLFLMTAAQGVNSGPALPEKSNSYYLCGGTRGGYPLIVPRELHCRLPQSAAVKTNVAVELYVPRDTPVTHTGYRCRIKKRRICTNTGFFGGKGIVSDTISATTVSADQCRKVVETKQWYTENGYLKLVDLGSKLWSTNIHLKVEYSWYCTDHCAEAANFVVEEGQIATMDGLRSTSDLGDVGGCQIQSGMCHSPDGVIVWDTKPFQAVCEFTLSGTFKYASISDQHIMIDEETVQGAFSTKLHQPDLRGYKYSCLPTESILMDQGVAIRFLDATVYNKISRKRENADPFLTKLQSRINKMKPGDTIYFSGREEDNIENKDVLSGDPVNAKLQLLFGKIRLMWIQAFREVWKTLCTMANQSLKIVWQILRLDATLGARILVKRDDIYATFTGEALMIWKCKEIVPDEIFWDYKYRESCYEYIPILNQTRLYFIVPGSNDLVEKSRKMSCVHHHSGIYKTATNDWRTVKGPIHVNKVPAELVWQNQFNVFTFSAPAVFHDKFDRAAVATIGLLKSYFSKVETLHFKLQALTNNTAELSYDPRIVRQTIAGIGDAVSGVLRGAGQEAGHVVEELESALKFFYLIYCEDQYS